MNLSQIIEMLPPRVYLRNGELVIHFSTPGDLIARVTETHAALSEFERPELSRSDTRTRARANGRSSAISTGCSRAMTETDPMSATGTSDGKED